MLKKKWIILCLLFTFLLAGCGPALPDNEGASSTPTLDVQKDGSTLIMGMTNAPASQNPFNIPGASEKYAVKHMYDTLLDITAPGEFQDRLGHISTEDNQTFTVTLHEAYWTDGEPVTADDVVYTLNTIAHPDTVTSLGTKIAMLEGVDATGKYVEGADSISGVQKIDDQTVELRTQTPVDINYLSEYLGTDVPIAPEHVFSQYAPADILQAEPAVNPTVTSGAYKFVDYQEENYLHLEANENYHRGEPKIKNLYIRVLDGTSLVTELQSGNIDLISGGGFGDIPHNDIGLVEDVQGLVVERHPSPNIQYMYINTERFPESSQRQALAMAIDRQLTVDNLIKGNGEVPPATYYSGNNYYNDQLSPVPFDPEEAKRLLEASNFDTSAPVRLLVPVGNTTREQNADLIAQQLQAIGLNVVIEKYDFATQSAMVREGDFDLALQGMAHNFEPDMTYLIGSGGSNNYSRYSNPEMDALLAAGKEATNVEDRLPIYHDLQRYFLEELPVIPLYSENVYTAQTEKLKGGIQGFWPASIANVHEWELVE